MIRVPVKTKHGVYRFMRTRVPRTRTFDLYRTAEARAPELREQLYLLISRDVESRATETVHRSVLLDAVEVHPGLLCWTLMRRRSRRPVANWSHDGA
jgi:hypothetical protein